MIVEINNNFQKEVLNSSKKVLVDFWASWCNPCKLMHPVLDELDKIIGDSLIIAKINIDNNSDIASKYNVMSIPTFMLFENGKPKKTIVGMQDIEKLKRFIDEPI